MAEDDEAPQKRVNVGLIVTLAVAVSSGFGWIVATTVSFTATLEGLSASIEANRVELANFRRESMEARGSVFENIRQVKADLQEEIASDRSHFLDRMDIQSTLLRTDLLSRLHACEEARAAKEAE